MGRAVLVTSDKKIVETNTKMSDNRGHVCHHGDAKVKAAPDQQPRPVTIPQQPEPRKPAKTERLEDVFQDDIVRRFAKMADFKKFARSNKGLRLSNYDVESIVEDYRNGEEQRMQMLFLWKQKLGKNATPQKIKEVVDSFFNDDEDED